MTHSTHADNQILVAVRRPKHRHRTMISEDPLSERCKYDSAQGLSGRKHLRMTPDSEKEERTLQFDKRRETNKQKLKLDNPSDLMPKISSPTYQQPQLMIITISLLIVILQLASVTAHLTSSRLSSSSGSQQSDRPYTSASSSSSSSSWSRLMMAPSSAGDSHNERATSIRNNQRGLVDGQHSSSFDERRLHSNLEAISDGNNGQIMATQRSSIADSVPLASGSDEELAEPSENEPTLAEDESASSSFRMDDETPQLAAPTPLTADASSSSGDYLRSSPDSNNDNNNNNEEAEGPDSTVTGNMANEGDEVPENSHEAPADTRPGADSLHMLDRHNMHLRAMRDMFERRQMMSPNHQLQQQQHTTSSSMAPLQSSQELSPISIGLDPNSPFGLGSPFSLGGHEAMPPPPQLAPHPHKPQMANADNLDPALPYGLNPLPHLLGFQGPSAGFDGPQRGDQSAHTNHHASAPVGGESESSAPVGGAPGQAKVWPKIFRFTDGRINLSEFEKQKKIRLSNKNQHGGENHIDQAPIMFDGRQLKRKSFLILHGGIFSRRR